MRPHIVPHMEERRRCHIRHIKETEKTYLDRIAILNTIVRCQLEELVPSQLSQSLFNSLFAGLPEIIALTQQFYTSLCEAAGNEESNKSSTETGGMSIADVFMEHARFFLAYSTYLINYADTDAMLSRAIASSTKLQRTVTVLRDNGVDIPSLRIEPVQRMPRYALLLRDLLGYTSTDDPGRSRLEAAAKELEAVTQDLNSRVAEARQRTALMTLQRRLVHWPKEANLLQPHRRFLGECGPFYRPLEHQGIIPRKTEIELKKRHMFICSDLIILTSGHGTRSGLVHDMVDSTTVRYKSSVSLTGAHILPLGEYIDSLAGKHTTGPWRFPVEKSLYLSQSVRDLIQRGFVVKSPNGSLLLIAGSMELRDGTIQTLRDTVGRMSPPGKGLVLRCPVVPLVFIPACMVCSAEFRDQGDHCIQCGRVACTKCMITDTHRCSQCAKANSAAAFAQVMEDYESSITERTAESEPEVLDRQSAVSLLSDPTAFGRTPERRQSHPRAASVSSAKPVSSIPQLAQPPCLPRPPTSCSIPISPPRCEERPAAEPSPAIIYSASSAPISSETDADTGGDVEILSPPVHTRSFSGMVLPALSPELCTPLASPLASPLPSFRCPIPVSPLPPMPNDVPALPSTPTSARRDEYVVVPSLHERTKSATERLSLHTPTNEARQSAPQPQSQKPVFTMTVTTARSTSVSTPNVAPKEKRRRSSVRMEEIRSNGDQAQPTVAMLLGQAPLATEEPSPEAIPQAIVPSIGTPPQLMHREPATPRTCRYRGRRSSGSGPTSSLALGEASGIMMGTQGQQIPRNRSIEVFQGSSTRPATMMRSARLDQSITPQGSAYNTLDPQLIAILQRRRQSAESRMRSPSAPSGSPVRSAKRYSMIR